MGKGEEWWSGTQRLKLIHNNNNNNISRRRYNATMQGLRRSPVSVYFELSRRILELA